MEVLVVLAVVVVVVLLVTAPLRRGAEAGARDDAAVSAERAELEAERDAKYREIRDAELDRRTGKLSDADWRAVDRSLRREAMELLRRLDELPDAERVR
jgi:type II secretory pathway pseudopilin PulG